MEKQEVINELKKQYEKYKQDYITEDKNIYPFHILGLIINFLEENKRLYSTREFNYLIHHTDPLWHILNAFVNYEDADQLCQNAIDRIIEDDSRDDDVIENEFDDEDDVYYCDEPIDNDLYEDIDYQEDEDDLPDYGDE